MFISIMQREDLNFKNVEMRQSILYPVTQKVRLMLFCLSFLTVLDIGVHSNF